MPTIIAFRDGQEFDRVVGEPSPEALLAWLDGVRAGEREIDRLRAAASGPDGSVDVRARLDLARKLLSSGALDAATAELLWLWEHMLEHEPSMHGVRLSFVLGDMSRLARQHEPAREAFVALRDRRGAAIEGKGADRRTLIDWVHLNEMLDEPEATLAWYDRVRDEPDGAELVSYVDRQLFTLLVDADRWADAGAVYAEPVVFVDQQVMLSESLGAAPESSGVSQETRQRLEAMRLHRLLEQVAAVYAACLAAGREDEAQRIAARLREAHDGPQTHVELVDAALEAGSPRPEHLQWLELAAGSDDPRLQILGIRIRGALTAHGEIDAPQ
jgi:hypothetical protein